jgi:hypothetical protein
MKRSCCFIIAVAVFLSGCETVSAFGTGKIRRQDLTYLARATTTFSDISGVKDDRQPEEQYTIWQRQKIWKQLASTDSWLEKNLW